MPSSVMVIERRMGKRRMPRPILATGGWFNSFIYELSNNELDTAVRSRLVAVAAGHMRQARRQGRHRHRWSKGLAPARKIFAGRRRLGRRQLRVPSKAGRQGVSTIAEAGGKAVAVGATFPNEAAALRHRDFRHQNLSGPPAKSWSTIRSMPSRRR